MINDDREQYRDQDTVDTDSDTAGPDSINNGDCHNSLTNGNSFVSDTKCATKCATEVNEISDKSSQSLKYKEDHNCENIILRQEPWTEAAIVKKLKECVDSNILQVMETNCLTLYFISFRPVLDLSSSIFAPPYPNQTLYMISAWRHY